MLESIHNYFQLGTLQWMSFPNLNALEAVQRIASDSDFDAVELTHIPDAAMRRAVRGVLEEAHMRAAFGAQPMLLGSQLNPNALDEAERQRAENVLLAAVDEAHELGAEGMSFLAGRWSREHFDAHYAQLLKTTRNVCDHAEKRNLRVELEVFDYDMDKAALIGPAPLAAEFAEDVRQTCGNFGLLADLSHFPTTYETADFAIHAMAKYVTHLHMGNAVVKPGCEAYGDKHPRFGFPNSANDVSELKGFFEALKREGLMNADSPMLLSFEVKPWGNEDAERVLAGCKRVLNRAWALARKRV